MPSEVNVKHLKINKLTEAQYESATKSDTELYLTPDTTDQDIADAISTHNSSVSAHSSLFATKQDLLPSQTGNSGKFLTTNGSTMSWGSVDALPSQSGQSGKYLTTNGTTASWGTISIPTVNDAVLAIQQNGLTITTFSANASTGATANIGTTIVKFRDWSD